MSPKCSLNLVFSLLYVPHQLSPSLHPRADREGETGNRCHVQAWPRGERQGKTKEGSAFSDRHYWLPVPLEGRLPTQQQPPQKVQGRGFLLSLLAAAFPSGKHPIESTVWCLGSYIIICGFGNVSFYVISKPLPILVPSYPSFSSLKSSVWCELSTFILAETPSWSSASVSSSYRFEN